MDRPQIRLNSTVLGAPDASELAAFYERLLGWERGTNKPGWVTLQPPLLGTGLSFQSEPDCVPPVWPSQPSEQQIMLDLDLAVDDLDAAVAWAVEVGARLADFQPQEDVRVMLDPVGHPFCLFPGTFE